MKKWITLTLSFCLTISIMAQPSFTENTIDGSYDGAFSVYAIDVDGDGDMDVVGAAQRDDDITWWENDGSQTFTKHTIDGSFDGAYSVFATDMDGDGDIDILGAAQVADDIAWWENDGSQIFTKHTIDANFNGAYSVYATDVDGDGNIDVLGAAFSDDDIVWWKNDGSENFTKNTIDGDFNGASSVYCLDVDGDGDKDVIGTAYNANEVVWWSNDGSENFTKNTIDVAFDGAEKAFPKDVDQDGDIDILGTASNDNDIVWWSNNGSQVFTKNTIDADFSGANGLYATDLDGDGDIDVLGGAAYGDEIAWFQNDGSESFTKQTIDNAFSSPFSVFAADIDSDGDMDILGTADIDDDVAWWESDLSNQALDFDGTDDYVSLGDMNELENITQFTALGWFYFDGTANGERLITNQSSIGSDVGWGITLGGSGTGENDDIRLIHNVDGSSKGSVYTDGLGLTTGKWYHIAVVFDGTQATATDRVTIYINGKVQTSNFNGFSTPTTLPTTSSPLVLGAKSDGSAGYFQGKMDEISLWRTSLSETTIHDIMHVMITDTTNLEAYYRFHAAAGTATFGDYSGKENVATWNGSSGANTSSTLSTETYPFTYERMNNARAIWSTIGTDAALASDGFYASPTPALTGTQRHVYGHDNVGIGTTTDDLSSTDATSRYSQTWQIDGTLALPTSVYFNLSTITGSSITAGTASNYVLLFRAGTSGNFLQFNTGNSVNGSEVEFTGVTLSPGYYTLGTKDEASSPLPVELLDFTGEKVENNVLLQWQTATEINNSHFDVEWSIDGFDFIKIGEVAGAGTTNGVQDYSFVHDLNLVGLEDLRGLNSMYYRLKQVDFDGKYEYSKTISIQLATGNGQSATRIYPNPATDFLIIENVQIGDIIQIFNTNGQLVKSIRYNSLTTQVSLNELRTGTYYVKMDSQIKKLIIAR